MIIDCSDERGFLKRRRVVWFLELWFREIHRRQSKENQCQKGHDRQEDPWTHFEGFLDAIGAMKNFHEINGHQNWNDHDPLFFEEHCQQCQDWNPNEALLLHLNDDAEKCEKSEGEISKSDASQDRLRMDWMNAKQNGRY